MRKGRGWGTGSNWRAPGEVWGGGAGFVTPEPAGQCGGVPARSVLSCDTPTRPRRPPALGASGCGDWLGEARGGGGEASRQKGADLLLGIRMKVS